MFRDGVISTHKLPIVMIVDDNARMRALIVSLIVDFADAIVECSDGAQAIARFELERPDLVLMDLAMGGVDGIAASRAIRRADATARIVIVTDHRGDALLQAALDAGALALIQKDRLTELPLWLSVFIAARPQALIQE